jgi:CRISPR-associated exonuclease Cas4
MIEITIRSIQHYLYCPHRWGLLEIDCAWTENAFVTKANILHERVHDANKSYTDRGKKTFTAVSVYNSNEPYNIYGVTDCIEGTECDGNAGVTINNSNKQYKLCIVEYKPTQPRDKEYNEDDLMQVFAQKICVDNVFHTDCDGVLYYADKKKRIKLPLHENYEMYDGKLKSTLDEMRFYLSHGLIPKILPRQKCNGCSMKNICIPKLQKNYDIRTRILDIGRNEEI